MDQGASFDVIDAARRSTRTLGGMIAITSSALATLDDLSLFGNGEGRVLEIRWDRGDADNIRGADGSVTWVRTSPRGWQVDIFTAPFEQLSQRPELQRFGHRVFVQPWLLPNPRFPGGVIDIEDGNVVFRPNAA